MRSRIIPYLWFDKDIDAVTGFYSSVFPGTKIKNRQTMENTPSGTTDILTAEILGLDIGMMTAGPFFKFTPAVSFVVQCAKKEEVEKYWAGLSKDGKALMELGEYPFSEKFGWIQDKYGLSWQLIYVKGGKITQRVIPMLMFTGVNAGKAEEAISHYVSVFGGSKTGEIQRYGKNEAPDKEGTVKHAFFTLEGMQFAAIDSAHPHGFNFTEAISFAVECKNQKEIDYYWEKLTAVPDAEQCGWLKDKYGLSWQIEAEALNKMLEDKDPAKKARVIEAFLKMKKFDIRQLEDAYKGK